MNMVASILVHVDASQRSRMRLDVARQLARRLGAAVTALYACAPQPAPRPSRFFAEGAVLMPEATAFDERCREQAHNLVEAGRDGVHTVWAELPHGCAITKHFATRAWLHDLVVLGQRDEADLAAGVPADFVESIVIEGARPVLVVPSGGEFGDVGRRVLIAWKPSREAARALTAALPLLQPGASVHVAAWGCDPVQVRPLLLHHGIEAEYLHEKAACAPVGEALLSLSADLGADLLVMGCYGHARMRELMLGGATHTVLKSMTLPVLMAH
ncbi:universal stress protein [Azohydromonas aeria]|uniref:universal stress protein n=1 Tax=Azohydromonas aeria TaxID=2590212 RepID=UPI0012F9297C|nr:universal stress protein [Azohydromonas aeria]